MFVLKKIIVRYLKDIIQRLEEDDCELTDGEAMDIMKVIAHRPLSKEQACEFMNLSRSRFDDLVREHKLPKGRKERGFKELRWYEDELNYYREIKELKN